MLRKYLIAMILGGMSLLPLFMIRGLGSFVGLIHYKFSKHATVRLKSNLLRTKMCNEDNLEVMAKQTAFEFGQTLVETMTIGWYRSKKYNSRFIRETINFDAVLAAVASETPIVFLTPHIGNFEIALKFTASKVKRRFTVLYKPAKEKYINQLMVSGRTEDNIKPVPTTRSGMVTLIKALKNKEIVGVLPDSVASSGDGVWVDFFGNKVFATTLAAKMVLAENATTFVVASRRVAGGFSVNYMPYKATTTDIALVVQDLYKVFEKMILEAPEQYYWSYDRFRVPKHAPVIS